MGRFFRTPKGILLLLFVPLLGAAAAAGGRDAAVALGIGMSVAAAMDVALVMAADGEWIFPGGAMLTGLIVAAVLSVYEPWHVIGVTAAIAIVSKRIIRVRGANVFNPAALALVVAAVTFSSGESWWGALPDLGLVGVIPIAVAGAVIVEHINKWPLVLSFLGSYFVTMTVVAFLGDATQVSEVFRAPDVNAAAFFACFMLDDPPTCPTRYQDQVVFGILTATVDAMVFVVWGPVYFLLAGLLVANAWEALRRILQARDRRTRTSAAVA